ncbi:MAG: zinc ribbon domain-containing protein [Candidatus Kariarchaeaceae archaeon]|jgi:hypothetical protein
MSKDFNASVLAMGISGMGFILILLSPGRNFFANWTLLFGLLGNVIMHAINSILLRIRSIRDFQGFIFAIKIVNFIFIILAIIGMLFGKFLATWSPFWFFPFGYYVFISFTIIYTLYFDMGQLYKVYLQVSSNPNPVYKCPDCNLLLKSSWIFCPNCGNELNY